MYRPNRIRKHAAVYLIRWYAGKRSVHFLRKSRRRRSLRENNMDLIEKAIERLKIGEQTSLMYYNKPLMICYSGGKDSDVLIELAKIANINFEVVHSHTTADAPETVIYIRKRFHSLETEGIRCSITYPVFKSKPTSMWDLIVQKKIPPTRLMRYCCDVLKETSGKTRAVATGVRWAESQRRKSRGIYEDISKNKENRIILNNDNDDKRRWFERCEIKAKTVINPIIDWMNTDVFDFLKEQHCELNPLYGCGFHRIGCIGCPMAGKKMRYMEFRRYPKYEQLYIHAFDRMIEARQSNDMVNTWQTGYDVFRWWLEEDFNQYELGDEYYMQEEKKKEVQ